MTQIPEASEVPPPTDNSIFGYYRLWALLIGVTLLDQCSKWIITDLSGFTMGLYPPFDGVVIIPGFFFTASSS